jgi:cystathionine beta-lyase
MGSDVAAETDRVEVDRPGAVDPGRVRHRAGVKWSKHGPDVSAAWVADMDYDPPAVVVDALRTMLDDGDLGYRVVTNRLAPAFAAWQERRHAWCPDPGRVRTFTSVLHALETVLWFTTEPGDGVVVLTPVYHPFLHAIADSGRRRVDVPLDPAGWRIDPERLDAAIDERTRLVLFCQPQNPTGRVFDDEEITALAEVVDRHDLLVVSDEIWADLAWDRPHRPLAVVDGRFAGRLVTTGSASKSFNLAGLRCSVAHVDHQPLNDVFASMPHHLRGSPSTLSAVGTLAAWEHGEPWLESVRTELLARRDQLVTRVAADLPGVRMDPPEATYLAWLDLRETRLGGDPADRLLAEGRVALSGGLQFGDQGAGFARLNFATTEGILDEIVDRIADVVADDAA